MEAYQKRLIHDYIELDEKINSLQSALDKGTEFCDKVGDKQYTLLNEQLKAMQSYLSVLKLRIDDLKIWQEYSTELNKHNIRSGEHGLTREKVLLEAYQDCLREMYAKAQPSASYDEYIQKVENGLIDESKEGEIYKRHYLSQEEYIYIIEKYIDAYALNDKWSEHCDLISEFFNEVKWDKIESFDKIIDEILSQKIQDAELRKKLSDEIFEKIIERIDTCRHFYRGNREESSFRFSIGLGCSPISNKETVINYWQKQGKDITIVDHDPNTFFEKDMYGEDYEEEVE